MNVGKPTVWMRSRSACLISASVAPASRAFLIWVSRARGCLEAPEMAILISQRDFSGRGPDSLWIFSPRAS